MPTAEDLVDLTSEQGADVEDKWESNLEAVQRLYKEILTDPERMDEDTALRAILSMADRRVETQGEEAAERYADNLGAAVALGWDDLQDVPNRNHDDVWRDAIAVLSGVALRQAIVESGLAVALVEGGVDAELRAAPIAAAIGLTGLKQASKLGKLKRIKEKRAKRKAAREVPTDG